MSADVSVVVVSFFLGLVIAFPFFVFFFSPETKAKFQRLLGKNKVGVFIYTATNEIKLTIVDGDKPDFKFAGGTYILARPRYRFRDIPIAHAFDFDARPVDRLPSFLEQVERLKKREEKTEEAPAVAGQPDAPEGATPLFDAQQENEEVL